jgi:hypothetical protein
MFDVSCSENLELRNDRMRGGIPILISSARERLGAQLGAGWFLPALATMLLALFLYEPVWFSRTVEFPAAAQESACSVSQNPGLSAALRLEAAEETEREGNVTSAEKQYLEVAGSSAQCVSMTAQRDLKRIQAAKRRWGLAYGIMADWAFASYELRTPLIFIYLAIAAYLALARFVPRKGVRIGTFSVHGSNHEEVVELFIDSLTSFSAAIRRAYEADYLRRAGLSAVFEDLTGPTVEDADPFEKALADAGESHAKSVVTLTLKALKSMRQLSERPRFELKGKVFLLPDAARVTATLKDLSASKGKEITLDAALVELDVIPCASTIQEILIQSAASGLDPYGYVKGEDLRQVAKQLQGLALVLASKIRFMQLQAKEIEYRPSNWVTVCTLTAAAALLEE